MKTLLKLFVMVLVFLVMSSFTGRDGDDRKSMLTEYQRNVITYFQEVALGFEYGTAPRITRKWAGPMKVYVEGTRHDYLLKELETVVGELNSLITDDFHIQIVDDPASANYIVFFGKPEDYRAKYSEDVRFTWSNSGIYRVYWNSRNNLTRGRMFVDTQNTDEIEQRSVLREELTQSLGLGRDSEMVEESIFQARYTTPTQFADIDREIIRLLYHPRMKAGLSEEETDNLLTEILLAENELRAFRE